MQEHWLVMMLCVDWFNHLTQKTQQSCDLNNQIRKHTEILHGTCRQPCFDLLRSLQGTSINGNRDQQLRLTSDHVSLEKTASMRVFVILKTLFFLLPSDRASCITTEILPARASGKIPQPYFAPQRL